MNAFTRSLWIVSTKERSYVISNWSAAQRINSGPSTPPMVKAPKIGYKSHDVRADVQRAEGHAVLPKKLL